MDLYSRKIIAWTLSRTLEVDEVLKCLETAKNIRKTANPVVIQSDRGVHYTSKKNQELTKDMVAVIQEKAVHGIMRLENCIIYSSKESG